MNSGAGAFGNTLLTSNNLRREQEVVKEVANEVQTTYETINRISELFALGVSNLTQVKRSGLLSERARVSVFADFTQKIQENPDIEGFYTQQRDYIDNTLTGIEGAVQTFINNQLLTEENARLQEYENILTNSTLLMEYIENNYTNIILSDTFSVQPRTALKISPEHLYYIRTYGYPDNGVFTSSRLLTSLDAIVAQWAEYGFASSAEANVYRSEYINSFSLLQNYLDAGIE